MLVAMVVRLKPTARASMLVAMARRSSEPKPLRACGVSHSPRRFPHHLAADERQQNEGDPVVVVDDDVHQLFAGCPADERHDGLEQPEHEADEKHVRDTGALERRAAGDGNGEGVGGESDGEDEDSDHLLSGPGDMTTERHIGCAAYVAACEMQTVCRRHQPTPPATVVAGIGQTARHRGRSTVEHVCAGTSLRASVSGSRAQATGCMAGTARMHPRKGRSVSGRVPANRSTARQPRP